MSWPDFIRQGAARWIAAGGVLAGLAGIVLGQTLFSPDFEVLYSGGVDVAHCAQTQERRVCAFTYSLALGNTGKRAQDTLRIAWPLDLRHLGLEAQVADIVASAQPTSQPQILAALESGRTVYTISGLMPNTLVRLHGGCLVCTPEQLQALGEARATIEARGTVAEGDPRVSALQRGAMNALRLVGLFY